MNSKLDLLLAVKHFMLFLEVSVHQFSFCPTSVILQVLKLIAHVKNIINKITQLKLLRKCREDEV